MASKSVRCSCAAMHSRDRSPKKVNSGAAISNLEIGGDDLL